MRKRDARGRFLPYTIEERWDLYSKEYDKAEQSLKRQGRQMYLNKLTKAQFKARIIAEENTGKKAGAAFVREFVDASKYKVTRSQAQVRKKAFKKHFGKDFRIADIRKETKAVMENWNAISSDYYSMKETGLSSSAAAGMISWLYFDSK